MPTIICSIVLASDAWINFGVLIQWTASPAIAQSSWTGFAAGSSALDVRLLMFHCVMGRWEQLAVSAAILSASCFAPHGSGKRGWYPFDPGVAVCTLVAPFGDQAGNLANLRGGFYADPTLWRHLHSRFSRQLYFHFQYASLYLAYFEVTLQQPCFFLESLDITLCTATGAFLMLRWQSVWSGQFQIVLESCLTGH